MVTIEEWYTNLPPLTRFWLASAVVTGLMAALGVPVYPYLELNWNSVLSSLQVWRLLTCFLLFGPVSMRWVMSVFMMTQYVRALELEGYHGRRGMAEFLFMTLYGCICILVLSFFQQVGLPSISLLSFYIYVWSRRDPHDSIDIYGFTFQRWHLPLVMLFLQMIFNGLRFDPFWAVFIGHGWVFLTMVVPRVYRRTVVSVPEWWYEGVDKVLDAGQAAVGGRPAARASTVPGSGVGGAGGAAAEARPTWMRGPGRRLDE